MFRLPSLKALLIVLVVLFCFSDSYKAQVYSTTPSSKVSFTIGMTVSDLVKDSINYNSGILFNAGFVYSLRLSEKLNASIELLYSGKGVKTESPIVKYRYFYLDLPLYLQYNFSEKIRANVGGQYSVFTNSLVSQIDGSNSSGVNNIRYKNIKNTDYSFLLGVEIDITEKVSLTTRYTLSSSTFFQKNKSNFGVFSLAFKINFYSTYRQFFAKTKD